MPPRKIPTKYWIAIKNGDFKCSTALRREFRNYFKLSPRQLHHSYAFSRVINRFMASCDVSPSKLVGLSYFTLREKSVPDSFTFWVLGLSDYGCTFINQIDSLHTFRVTHLSIMKYMSQWVTINVSTRLTKAHSISNNPKTQKINQPDPDFLFSVTHNIIHPCIKDCRVPFFSARRATVHRGSTASARGPMEPRSCGCLDTAYGEHCLRHEEGDEAKNEDLNR